MIGLLLWYLVGYILFLAIIKVTEFDVRTKHLIAGLVVGILGPALLFVLIVAWFTITDNEVINKKWF